MGRIDGKVAFITGAARGQGRSHAVRLAEEGADIIAIDICKELRSNVAPPASTQDLEETARLVEKTGRRAVIYEVDVRNFEALRESVEAGIESLGRLDIVCANAGAWTYGKTYELSQEEWGDILDVVLTGVWNTCRATIPILIEQGCGGSIIITSSVLGLKGVEHVGHYVAAKHGTVGLMRSLALELAQQKIRVNTVNPGTVDTALVQNDPTYRLFAPDLAEPTKEEVATRFEPVSAMRIPWVEPIDVSNAVLFLASDEARYITGIALPIDGGTMLI